MIQPGQHDKRVIYFISIEDERLFSFASVDLDKRAVIDVPDDASQIAYLISVLKITPSDAHVKAAVTDCFPMTMAMRKDPQFVDIFNRNLKLIKMKKNK